MDQGDKANADAVLEVSISANADLYERIRGDEVMCKAMEDLMQDVITQREEKAKLEEKKNIAESLIQRGRMALDEIAVVTGLTLEAVDALKQGMAITK